MSEKKVLKNGAHHVSEEESLRVAEEARETSWENESFLRELFLGKFRFDMVYPFPELKGINRPEFEDFYNEMKQILNETDSDRIDREGQIPYELIKRLADAGAFGMKIDKKYGGLGLSLSEYTRIMKLVTSRDGNLTALLSAHQSIGVPQPLVQFGTEAQKEKYLPRIAKGAVTAFALTESDVGSDPAKLATSVEESEDGAAYILNGEKLWCTNGTLAELIVVMARHTEDDKLSAFIVETDWPGVEIVHRCRFMGLKAIENGVIRFTNVRVPKNNLLWERGRGLKLALMTLNIGRLSLPAAAAGGAKACVEISRKWAAERVQWGQAIGKHEAIAHKLADMASNTFALESVADLATAMAENGFDIRLEAATAKMYNTEVGWSMIDDTLQIRGGRGYETSDSLKQRGEEGIPVERMMRDARINLIFEGSSEIMRLFIAREAVDKHLQVAGTMLDPKASIGKKLAALPGIGFFYATWYGSLLLNWSTWPRYVAFGKMGKHLRYAHRATRKLARQIFHGMMRHQAKLQYKQAFLGRIVEIGAELFAMAATISRARKLKQQGNENAIDLADVFCMAARRRIDDKFKALWSNDDVAKYSLARKVLDGSYEWVEDGSAGLQPHFPAPQAAPTPQTVSKAV